MKNGSSINKSKPNIIFILIDALRARNVGCYGYPINTTPNIDDIAENSIIFQNAFSCINATDPSITSIFSGNLPMSHGLINHGSRVKKQEIYGLKFTQWLPEILKQHGYHTLAVDWLGRWHRRGFDFYNGFERDVHINDKKKDRTRINKYAEIFVRRLKYKIPSSVYNILRRIFRISIKKAEKDKVVLENAEKITNKAIRLINKNKSGQFFIFLHYWDVHWPYNTPKQFGITRDYNHIYETEKAKKSLKNNKKLYKIIKNRYLSEGGLEYVIKKYDNAIKYVDSEIGRLISFLKEEGLFDNTLLIITSDHGESFLEHGIFFDHHGLYDVSIKVPLMIHHPKLSKSRKINALVQHVDILPTILDLLDIKIDYSFDGHSLMPLIYKKIDKIRDFIIIEEAHTQRKIGLRTLELKYIRDLHGGRHKCRYCEVSHGAKQELYNLYTDPEEKNNIAQEQQETISYLYRNLLSERSKLKQRSIMRTKLIRKERIEDEDVYSKEDEKKVKERLRSLGYLD